MSRATRQRLVAAIASMPVFNHHEHAVASFSTDTSMYRWPDAEEYDLIGLVVRDYLRGDLAAAGFTADLGVWRDTSERDDAWAALLPYLERVRNTSYFACVARSIEGLFGIAADELFTDRWREADDKVRAWCRTHPASGPELCARMNIRATALDGKLDPDEMRRVDPGGHRLLQVARMDHFIHEERGLADTLESVAPKDFNAWLDAFDRVFQDFLDAGAAGFKLGLAYQRRIEFDDVPREDAARIFDAGVLDATPADKTAYQDFMVNRLCAKCVAADVSLQIHAGIQAGGGVLENTRPTLLTSLFQRHPELRVDLFHGGYPWVEQAGLMAKYFPNVHIDGCWLSHISPSGYRRALRSWIETVPGSKIFAFGGDHTRLELTWGALALAKDLLADVLAELVDEGYFGAAFAETLAARVLHDNGAAFWRID